MSEEGIDQPKKISRRDFLKLAGIGIGGVTVACAGGEIGKKVIGWFLTPPSEPEVIPPIPTQAPQPDNREFPPDLVFTGESHQYDGEAARIIEGVKKDYGISIISPKTWGEKNEPNMPYGVREIAYIAEAISSLPPEYQTSSRSPREVLLLRAPGSASEGAGGGYNGRRIILFTSETFDGDRQMHGQAGELYGTERDHLKATVTHEYTHSFTEATPGLQDSWNTQAGWSQKSDGSWTNDSPGALIHDGGADVSPGEDIAVSAGLMFVKPESLSPNRRDFFLANPHYASWPTISAYKETQH